MGLIARHRSSCPGKSKPRLEPGCNLSGRANSRRPWLFANIRVEPQTGSIVQRSVQNKDIMNTTAAETTVPRSHLSPRPFRAL